MPTAEEVQELADAVFYALDDMRGGGHSVCPYSKAKLRIAYEPFFQAEVADPAIKAEPPDMPLDFARQLVDDADAGR